MTIGTRLYTWLKGELVGNDALGNRYYREKSGRSKDNGVLAASMRRERRWVLYDGEALVGFGNNLYAVPISSL